MGGWIFLPWLIVMMKIFIRAAKSIKLNIFVIILAVGVLPASIIGIYVPKYYHSSHIDERHDKLYSSACIIKDLIESTDYLNVVNQTNQTGVENTPDVVSMEINQLTADYAGRVIIVDSSFTIVKDTNIIDEKKTCITDDVIECFSKGEINYYNSDNHTIEIAMQVKGELDAKGVAYFSFYTDDIEELTTEITLRIQIVLLISFVVLIGIALVYAYLFVKPFKILAKNISNIRAGHIEDEIPEGGYTEIAHVSKSFNHVLKKMNALDTSRQEFVSNVSHELKTPITSIKVLADSILMQDGIPEEMYKEFLTDIAQEIDRENQIITDLLNLVKMDKKSQDLNIVNLDINELIERVLKRLKPIAAKKNIELVFESFRPVLADVDEVKFTMVISNLVENAIKYNVMDGWVKVSLNADLKYFYVKIQDSGIGIPEDDVQHVFERFYRVDKARSRETGGTGLGLAITDSAIRMHNGEIKLYSVEGEGTTFTVRVPLSYTKIG